jgi:hypothetical protein
MGGSQPTRAAVKPVEDHSLGHRIVLTVVIVVVILLLLAAFGYLTGRWDEAGAQAITNSKWDGRMIELDKAALDDAYKAQLTLVWKNWLLDGGPPTRHAAGFAKARNGYIASMTEIEKRERQQ